MSWIKFARTIVLAWMATASAGAWAAGGYLYDAAGSVTVAIGKGDPRPAVKNNAVDSGTVIRTGDKSSAVLKFADGQVVSMQANSTFQVRSYTYEPKKAEGSNIVFSMLKGGMRFITGEIGQRNKKAFKLVTPHATIGIRGTEFMLVMAQKGTYSQVMSGSISMTNGGGTAVIAAGQTALTSSATALTTTVTASSVPAGTFGQLAAIPVPPATPAPVPSPAGAAASTGTTATTGTTSAATGTAAGTTAATTTTAAGGAAAGGAAASTAAAGGVIGGVSATTIGIGVGVAAVAAAVVNTSTTTHH